MAPLYACGVACVLLRLLRLCGCLGRLVGVVDGDLDLLRGGGTPPGAR